MTLFRIMRRRVKGWRMPPNTVSVTRPGPYGNPYFPGCGLGFGSFDSDMHSIWWQLITKADMVRHFCEHMRLMKEDEPRRYEEYIAPLRGKNLACFCKLCPTHAGGKPFDVECDDCDPCHADVFGIIVNFECKEAA